MSGSLRPVTKGEQRFAEDFMRSKGAGNELLFLEWVMVRRTKKKKEEKVVGADKAQERLLATGNHLLAIIKRNARGKKSVQKEGHFLDLQQIILKDSHHSTVSFVFKTWQMECSTARGLELVGLVKNARSKIACGYPLPPAPDSCFLQAPLDTCFGDVPSETQGICGGLIDTYMAWCSYYEAKPSPDFQSFVEGLAFSGSTDLDLSTCPGIDPKTGYSFDLLPVLSSLSYNKHFTSFVLKDVQRREAPQLFAKVFASNSHLTRVVLSGLDSVPEGFVAIGNALKLNSLCALEEIDFSNNKMGDKGALALAQGLQALHRGLSSINLAYNNISSKGVCSLISALEESRTIPKFLTSLDLSGNKLDKSGTQELVNLLAEMCNKGDRCPLVHLNVSDSGIEAFPLISSLRLAASDSLEYLNLSSNKIDKSGAQSLALLLETSKCLSTLSISNCKLSAEAIEMFFQSIKANEHLKGMALDLSSNDMGVTGARNFVNSVSGCDQLSMLSVADNKLTDEGLKSVVDCLAYKSNLKCLDLSFNCGKTSNVHIKECVESIGELLVKNTGLEALNLAGDSKACVFGPVLAEMFKSLGENSTLKELDISGNKLTDQAIVRLFDALRNNRSLRNITVENNGMAMGGLMALRNALLSGNKSLIDVDVERATEAVGTLSRTKERPREILDEVAAALKNNRAGEPQSYTKKFSTIKKRATFIPKESALAACDVEEKYVSGSISPRETLSNSDSSTSSRTPVIPPLSLASPPSFASPCSPPAFSAPSYASPRTAAPAAYSPLQTDVLSSHNYVSTRDRIIRYQDSDRPSAQPWNDLQSAETRSPRDVIISSLNEASPRSPRSAPSFVPASVHTPSASSVSPRGPAGYMPTSPLAPDHSLITALLNALPPPPPPLVAPGGNNNFPPESVPTSPRRTGSSRQGPPVPSRGNKPSMRHQQGVLVSTFTTSGDQPLGATIH